MGELVTKADHNLVWQPMPYRKSSVSHDSDALIKQFGLVFNNRLRIEVVMSLQENRYNSERKIWRYYLCFHCDWRPCILAQVHTELFSRNAYLQGNFSICIIDGAVEFF